MASNTQQSISVRLLMEALAEKEAVIRPLQAEVDDLRRAIQKLQFEGSIVTPAIEPLAQEPSATSGMSAGEIVRIIKALDQIDENDYPIDVLKGLTRLGVARLIAQKNAGYITGKANKKILSRSGILRGTKQINSISSRVLNESQDFVKVWEGLYRLKEYSNDQEQKEAAEAAP